MPHTFTFCVNAQMRQRSENLIERLAVGGEMPKRHTHSILKKFNGDRRSSGRKGTSYKYPGKGQGTHNTWSFFFWKRQP